ncbi:MAG: class I SAM-dependent methyltransferase [Brevinematales bacterium]|nr:class I SAM-dependent methyltransferase [Brevinematales bacterium]
MPKTEPFDLHRDRYENWFERHQDVYSSEINAVRELIPIGGAGLEIGVGTGRFAAELGIRYGVDPSEKMLDIAREKGIDAVTGVAEHLPFGDEYFDFALMVTTICFVDDPLQALKEAYRVLKQGGSLIVGFVDKNSALGKEYLMKQNESVFYKDAVFFSVDDIIRLYQEAGFSNFDYRQTIFGKLDDAKHIEQVKKGYGEGSFVVIRGLKIR